MARIRTVKPEMAQDEDLASVSIEAQLLAVRILNHADDEGYFKANPALVKANCFPLLDSVNVHGMLTELSEIGYIRLSSESKDGKHYGWIVKFLDHQKVSHPKQSRIKDIAKFTERSRNVQGTFLVGMEGKGREGKGTNRATAARFPDWWAVVPKGHKKDRKECERIWKRDRLDAKADILIKDTQERAEKDGRWRRGFIPNMKTYLNGEKWNDDFHPIDQAGESKSLKDISDPELLALAKQKGISTDGLYRNQLIDRIQTA